MTNVKQPRPASSRRTFDELELWVPCGSLGGKLYLPPGAYKGAVIIAHPSAIRRLTSREGFAARALAQAGFATLLLDLLTEEEDQAGVARLDVELLAERLLRTARVMEAYGVAPQKPFGYYGIGVAAAAALLAMSMEPGRSRAMVSRSGCLDSVGAFQLTTKAPSLFIVTGNNPTELAANRAHCHLPQRRLEVVPCSGDFVEGDAFDRTISLSISWFTHWLDPLFERVGSFSM